MKLVPMLVMALALTACTTSPPKNPGDICDIFDEKSGWYDDAAKSRDAWGSPIPVMMAIIHQESRFHARARPPRKKILGFIPGPRPSSAYGYSQAKTTTWREYKQEAGRFGADRDEFDAAIDFVGWYNAKSHKRSGVSRQDPYRLYLAYHEGHGGFNRGTYRNKPWLLDVARNVERRANTYQSQLQGCEEDLKNRGWLFGLF